MKEDGELTDEDENKIEEKEEKENFKEDMIVEEIKRRIKEPNNNIDYLEFIEEKDENEIENKGGELFFNVQLEGYIGKMENSELYKKAEERLFELKRKNKERELWEKNRQKELIGKIFNHKSYNEQQNNNLSQLNLFDKNLNEKKNIFQIFIKEINQ